MPQAPSDTLSRRHAAIRHRLTALGLDALVVTSMPNVLYLTNFTGSSAIVVLTADRLLFVTDFRYVAAIDRMRGTAAECPSLEIERVDSSYDETLAALLDSLPGARVGFEARHLTVGRHQWLEASLGKRGRVALVPTDGVVEAARVIKDAFEIAMLREGAARLSRVARQVLETVRRGQSERELAAAIDDRLRGGGFEKPAFDTIVASGPNGALPHAQPGERKLTEGDLVVLDFGGVYASYCVDLTRTVSIGAPAPRAREVYAAVLEAHDLAIAAVAPGRSRFDIDAAARDALGRRGLAEAFGHGTGHGLGIDVHEDPRITRRRAEPPVSAVTSETEGERSTEQVSPGMVFTIEPGAYIPGWGGVRIEDDVLVTGSGVDVLTNVTTELVEI
jgi:Xaa-Pro aminopeptidase